MLHIQRQLELKHDIPNSLFVYGRVAFRQGQYKQAHAYFEESIALNDEIGRSGANIWAYVDLAYLLLRQGEITQARARFVDSLKRVQNGGNMVGEIFVLEGLASLALAEGRPERAARLFGWADGMRQKIGNHRPTIEQADVDQDIVTIRLQLNEAAIEAAQATGRAMTLEEAVAYALEQEKQKQRNHK